MSKVYDLTGYKVDIDLALNEYVGNDDPIGLFPTDPAKDEFLSIENIDKVANGNEDTTTIRINLSDKKWTHERQVYNLMTLIGDFGGFNSAITIIPALIMSYFSEMMFKWSVASNMPIKS